MGSSWCQLRASPFRVVVSILVAYLGEGVRFFYPIFFCVFGFSYGLFFDSMGPYDLLQRLVSFECSHYRGVCDYFV